MTPYTVEPRREGNVNYLVVVGPGVEMYYTGRDRATAHELALLLNSAARALRAGWEKEVEAKP